MPAFIHQIEHIPFAEFDLGGVLYHANYLRLYEQAREQFLRSIGYPYSQFMEQGTHLVVAGVGIEYKKPIRYGEVVTIALTASEIKRVSLRVNYSLTTINGVVNTGFTTMVFVRMFETEFRPDIIPATLRPAFQQITE